MLSRLFGINFYSPITTVQKHDCGTIFLFLYMDASAVVKHDHQKQRTSLSPFLCHIHGIV